MKLRYGTRGSPLALAQSAWVAAQLKQAHPLLDIERVVIVTSGDKSERLSGPDNLKAMFVKEIEEALLKGEIDFAVHSAKDLPGELPEGLEIGAYPEREDPRDVYVGGPKAPRWENVGVGAVIGTTSLRRQIQLRRHSPGITFTPMRGNVDTRLRKLAEGQASGLVLAKAGLKRLGRTDIAHQELSIDMVIPAPGQGALAVEARSDRQELLDVLTGIDHGPTRTTVECERLFLKEMGGGCSMPLGAYAELTEKGIQLSTFWSDAEGKNPIRRSGTCSAEPQRLAAFVLEMARQIRKDSGGALPQGESRGGG